jgi:hypothetical protein
MRLTTGDTNTHDGGLMQHTVAASDNETTGCRCAHPMCECMVPADTDLIRSGRYYCSGGCLEGVGCSHRDCECAED